MLGPSPRVRGAEPGEVDRVSGPGTIPAGAGSSHEVPQALLVDGDHPRGCGEQCAECWRGPTCPGPSPRVRGADRHAAQRRRTGGTIPAGAGSRRRRCCSMTGWRDHPRGGGEQVLPDRTEPSHMGPSPRVRGADVPAGGEGRSRGTIPAGAGSRTTAPRSSPTSRDHPRGCGEQNRSGGGTGCTSGPTPRVRGAAAGLRRLEQVLGTIPAGAGSSGDVKTAQAHDRDHPRGCGEQEATPTPPPDRRGPSPRVRGAVLQRPPVAAAHGTIPAGAGSRPRREVQLPPGRDHPRGCGEQTTCTESGRRVWGPSPRVRGAEFSSHLSWGDVGTIPAGAGSSCTAAP